MFRKKTRVKVGKHSLQRHTCSHRESAIFVISSCQYTHIQCVGVRESLMLQVSNNFAFGRNDNDLAKAIFRDSNNISESMMPWHVHSSFCSCST